MIVFFKPSRILLSAFSIAFSCLLTACGGGGGGSNPAPAPAPAPAPTVTPTPMPKPTPTIFPAVGDSNVIAIYVDAGLAGSRASIPNAIYADVKICHPSNPSQCAVIDHVIVDTGSVGLRVLASALPTNFLPALPQSTVGAQKAAQCLSFVSGVTWGSVRSVELRMGGSSFDGLTASNLPIQIINDPDPAFSTVPASCSSQGGLMQTAADLGAKGILGVGLFIQDCGPACANSAPSVYYACSGTGSCSASAMPLSKQVSNPISSWAPHDNGNTIWLPNLQSGSSARADGMLVVGVGTSNNNALQANSQILAANSSGTFTANVNGNTLARSFIDSGSSITFLPAAGSTPLSVCPTPLSSFFCPVNSLSLTATNTGRAGTSSQTNVAIINAANAFSAKPLDNAYAGLAGSSSAPYNSLDYGASFFFGRYVSTLIETKSATGFGVSGPAFSHSP